MQRSSQLDYWERVEWAIVCGVLVKLRGILSHSAIQVKEG